MVPKAEHVPPIETAATVTPSPHDPLGVKGAGEAGAIAAPPAVVNAVCDALEPLGVSHVDMPLTPEKSPASGARLSERNERSLEAVR